MTNDSSIHRVGYHLQCQAVSIVDETKDAFARSAYNRYYYSTFLRTRDLLRNMNPQWSSLTHSSYPEVLDGQVKRAFNNALKKARKSGDTELVKSIEQAKRSIAELKKILVEANSTRVVADYAPEKEIDFQDGERFSLQSVSITDAHAWADRAKVLCNSISKSWKHFNA